jgi:hypothetical protein
MADTPRQIAARGYEELRRRVEQEIRLGRARPLGACPACGDPVLRRDERVLINGAMFHASCVIYGRVG